MRKALLIIALAGLACGSRESSTSTDTATTPSQTPPVSAVQPPSEGNVPADTAAVEPVEVTTCLELVEAGKNAEAVVACQTAVELYPENTKAAAALAKANASGTVQGAADAAVQGVKDAANATAGAAKDAAHATSEAVKDAADARTHEAAKDAAEDAEDAVQ